MRYAPVEQTTCDPLLAKNSSILEWLNEYIEKRYAVHVEHERTERESGDVIRTRLRCA
jgi:hypothetical protein